MRTAPPGPASAGRDHLARFPAGLDRVDPGVPCETSNELDRPEVEGHLLEWISSRTGPAGLGLTSASV